MKLSTRPAKRKPAPIFFLAVLFSMLLAAAKVTAYSQQVHDSNLPSPSLQSPSKADLSLDSAKQLMAAGHFKEAEDSLRFFLAQDAHSADARYLLAYALLRQGQARQALDQYTRAAAMRVPTAAELIDVGKAYVLLEDYDDAGKWMQRSVSMNPDDPEAWYSLGRLRFTQQRFKEASECFKRALALSPDSVKIENNLGLAYEGLNQTDMAIAAYRQAIAWQEAGPAKDASEQPLLNLGIALEQQGQLDEARALLARAEVIAPVDPRIHEHLGQVATQQGNNSDAAKEFEIAVRLDPEKSNLHFLLGQAYRRLGRQQDAKTQLDAAARLIGTPSQP